MTQQATHTPGPWFSKRRGTQGVANYAVIETAANWHTEIARVYFGDRFVNGEANARLIAAAPELLAALKQLHAEADRLGNYLSDKGQGATMLGLACHKASAAIAKAEGK